MSTHNIISSGLLELYALGLCSPEEVVRVEEALADEAVRAEYDKICLALEMIAEERAVAPPPSLKENLMASLGEQEATFVETPSASDTKQVHMPGEKTAPARPKQSFISRLDWRMVAAASVVLLVGSLGMNYTYYQRLVAAEEEAAILRNNSMLLTDENGTLKAQFEVAKQEYAFLANKNLKAVTLSATTAFPDREALVFWDKDKGDVYLVSNALPALQANQQYQLWALDNGVPVDAGVLPETLSQGGAYKLKNIGSSQAFAITIEKAGGAVTPTLDQMVVFGSL